jgi:trigger factor
MKAELTDISACRKTLDIEIPQEIVDHEISHISRNLAKRARVPGFRPGKAPVSVVQTRYRDEIVSEMLQHLLPRYFSEAVKSKDLDIVDNPQFESVDYNRGQPVKFKAVFEVYPELDVTNYKGIPAEAVSYEVPESEVDNTLKKLQEDMSQLEPLPEERPALQGDFVEISFTGTVTGADEPLFSDKATVEVGGESTLREFTENLTGASVNEDRNFSVSYPDNYPEKRFSGKTVDYQVKVEAIKEKHVPELNDEFAQGLGKYSTLEELRSKVHDDLEKHRREHVDDEMHEKLLQWLEEHNEFEVPNTLVDRQIQIRMQRLLRDLSRQGVNPQRLDVDWSKIYENQREQAVRDVKGSLILNHVSEKEKIDVSSDEVDAEIDRIAAQMEGPRHRVQEALEKESGMARLRNQILNKKTLDFLRQHAVIQPAIPKAADTA